MLRMFLLVALFPPPLGSVIKSPAAFVGLVSMTPQINRNSTLYVWNHKKLPCFFGYCLHRFTETPGFTVLASDQ